MGDKYTYQKRIKDVCVLLRPYVWLLWDGPIKRLLKVVIAAFVIFVGLPAAFVGVYAVTAGLLNPTGGLITLGFLPIITYVLLGTTYAVDSYADDYWPDYVMIPLIVYLMMFVTGVMSLLGKAIAYKILPYVADFLS